MQRIVVTALLVAMPAAGIAAKRERVRIDYMLPATVVTAGVQQRITKCPASADVQAVTSEGEETPLRAEFEWKAALVAKQAPNRLVRLDAETGFLVDRETQVVFADDWFLKEFNGKTTGQGGPFVVSLVKAGAAFFAMTANPLVTAAAGLAAPSSDGDEEPPFKPSGLPESSPPAPRLYPKTRWYVVCRADVVRDLAALAEARTDIIKLEARVIAGDVSAPTQGLLALRRSQVADLEDGLTITATAAAPLKPAYDDEGRYVGLDARIGAVDIGPWFALVSKTRKVPRKEDGDRDGPPPPPDLKQLLTTNRLPGTYGYQVTIAVDETLAPVFGCKGAGTPALVEACWTAMRDKAPISTRDLVYTRPIPATAKIYPFGTECKDGAKCEPAKGWPEGDKATGTLAIKLPQLSRIYTMRTGGSIFGGRTIGARFGPLGEPAMLQYIVGSSGNAAAGLAEASVAAAQTVRDADNAAIKRRLDATRNRQDLEALLEAQATTSR